jgi:Fur family ferric uptake transcriptional regulator
MCVRDHRIGRDGPNERRDMMSTIVTEAHAPTNVGEENLDMGLPANLRQQVWVNFVAFLKKGGHNVTGTRHIILDTVLQRSDHFRADQLAAQLTSGPNRVSRGSVYRTLALLTEAGIIRTLRDGGAHVHYEHVIDRAKHEHMICDSCGKFIEFDPGEISVLIDRACDHHRFIPRAYRIVIYGRCEPCGNAG